nr:hypothetical protein [Sphingomonas sp. Y57]
MKTIFALAILSSVAAAPAVAESFTRDGITYDYTVRSAGKATVISGTVVTSGQPFHLRLRDGRVTGRVGFRQVSFRADPAAVAGAGNSSVFAAN